MLNLRTQEAIRAKCFHPTGQWEEFNPEDLNQSIVSRFAQMVARHPDRLALKAGAETLTYAELNIAANQLAHAILQRLGVGSEPVLFLMTQGVQAMVTIMGIHKAGKFYVALDHTAPNERLAYIAADSQARLLITHAQCLRQAQTLAATQPDLQLINLDDLPKHLPADSPEIDQTPESYAYIVYTSGSTGAPKGVIENHRDVLHFSRIFINTFHLCKEDRIGLSESNSFSGAAAKIYPALLTGATLCPLDLNVISIHGLSDWLHRDQVTFWLFVPSVFRQWVQTLTKPAYFPYLRLIGLGGDRILPSDIELYQQYFSPQVIFRVGFGLSEVKQVTFYFIDHKTIFPTKRVPIGYCVTDTEVLLINEQGQAVENGEIGEIVVKSRYVSPGYWRQPALTEARFHPDPQGNHDRLFYTGDLGMRLDDGCLFHMGRKDLQVKVKGMRVEVAEIEHVLWATGWFESIVVVARPDHTGEQRLVAYGVAAQHPAPSMSEIRRAASVKLPPAMIPAAYVSLAALPLNANGKVDLKALPDPPTARPIQAAPYMAARNNIEADIVEIWQEVLGLAPIGIHDHFLDLGGDSIRATQIITRISNQFNVAISPQILLAQPTIDKMALMIVQHQVELLDNETIERLLNEVENNYDITF